MHKFLFICPCFYIASVRSYICSYCGQNESIIWLFIRSREACHIWNMELIYSKGHYCENRWKCYECKTRFHLPLSLFLYFFLSFTFIFFQSEWAKINLLYFQWLKDDSDNIPIFIDVWIVLLTWYFKKYPSFCATILSIADLYDLRLFRLKTRLIQLIPELLCTTLLPSIVPSFVSEIIYYSGFLIESW